MSKERFTFGEQEPFDAFPSFTPGPRFPVLLDGERIGTLWMDPRAEAWELIVDGSHGLDVAEGAAAGCAPEDVEGAQAAARNELAVALARKAS